MEGGRGEGKDEVSPATVWLESYHKFQAKLRRFDAKVVPNLRRARQHRHLQNSSKKDPKRLIKVYGFDQQRLIWLVTCNL